MAVKKSDMDNMLNVQDQKAFKKIEAQIDAVIKKDYGKESNLLVYPKGAVTKQVQKKLKQVYKEAGWVLAFEEGDQRDPGNWIRIT